MNEGLGSPFDDKPEKVARAEEGHGCDVAAYYRKKAEQYFHQFQVARKRTLKGPHRSMILKRSSLQRRSTRSNEPFVEQFCVFGIEDSEVLEAAGEKLAYRRAKLIYSSKEGSKMDSCGYLVFPTGVANRLLSSKEVEEYTSEAVSWNYSSKNTFILALRQDEMSQGKRYLVCLGSNEFSSDGRTTAAHQRVYCLVSPVPCLTFLENTLIAILRQAKETRQLQLNRTVWEKDGNFMLHLVKMASNIKLREELQGQLNPGEELIKVVGKLTLGLFVSLFIQVFLQRKVVVECRNSNLLTHLLFLFTELLLQPFSYPYAVIYILPQDMVDFLQSPMPITIGTLQPVASDDSQYFCIGEKSAYLHSVSPRIEQAAIEARLEQPWRRMQESLAGGKSHEAGCRAGAEFLGELEQLLRREVLELIPEAEFVKHLAAKYEQLEMSSIDMDRGYFITESAAQQMLKRTSPAFHPLVAEFVASQMFYSYFEGLYAADLAGRV